MSFNVCCKYNICALHQKLASPLASCLSTCRGVPGSEVSGMIPTTFGKVEEAASVNRRLPRSCLTILQGWNRFRCDCLTMAALPPFHQRVCLSLLTLGGHCCHHHLATTAASVFCCLAQYFCCCSGPFKHTTALAVQLQSRSTCFAGAKDCSSASISFVEFVCTELNSPRKLRPCQWYRNAAQFVFRCLRQKNIVAQHAQMMDYFGPTCTADADVESVKSIMGDKWQPVDWSSCMSNAHQLQEQHRLEHLRILAQIPPPPDPR